MVNNILALQSEEWNTESVFDFSHKYVGGGVTSESRNTLQSVLRSALTTFPAEFDAKALTNATYMFYNCYNIESIPLIDTSNCTDFSYMFSGCQALTSVPQLDTSKGTTFRSMFNNCEALTTIPPLDTSNGTECRFMFDACRSLTSLGTDSLTDADGNLVKPWQFKVSIDFGYCPLDKTSIECVMNNLQTVSSTQTLTISKTTALNICGQTDKSYDYTSDTHYLEMMSVCTSKGWKVAVETSH